jgi:hypothetical protein
MPRNKEAAREKAVAVAAKLKEMKLKEAAKKIEDGIEETIPTWISLMRTGQSTSNNVMKDLTGKSADERE